MPQTAATDLLQPQPRTEKKRLSLLLFRRSKGPPPSSFAPNATATQTTTATTTPPSPELEEGKKHRFSLFRQSGRRSGLVLDAALFHNHTKAPSAPSSSSSSDAPSDSEAGVRSSGESVSDERTRALSILEGRTRRDSRPATATTTSPAAAPTKTPSTPSTPGETRRNTSTGAQSPGPTPTGSPVPAPAPAPTSFISALSRPASMSSRRSLSIDGRRASLRLGLVPENATTPGGTEPVSASASTGTILPAGRLTAEPEPQRENSMSKETEVDEHGLPTYASAAYPKRAATYRFAQAGPFGMTLAAGTGVGEEDVSGLGLGRYHVSVGVNVWAPRAYVTTVRRGLGEDGPLVAQIEAGCASVNASVSFGDVGRPLKEVMSKNLVNGSRIYYVGDGSAIHWKLGRAEWRAYFNSAPIATFSPAAPRTLVVQPTAHRLMDHLLVGVLLLMREKDDTVYARTDYGSMQLPPFA